MSNIRTRAGLAAAFLLGLLVAGAAHSQSVPPKPTAIRTMNGAWYEVPEEWGWFGFDGHTADLQHVATRVGEKGKEKSPNGFDVRLGEPDDSYDKGWGQLDRNEQRRLVNGALARWKIGLRWNMHYSFLGEITLGQRTLRVLKLDGYRRTFDPALMERAFLRIAETLREVPETRTMFHPGLGIAADVPDNKRWFARASARNIAFGCFQRSCGERSNTWIILYPSTVVIDDIRFALEDITGYFEKEAGLKIGEIRRTDIPGGFFWWTEQPGSNYPFLGAARRDGRVIFARVDAAAPDTPANDAIRDDFLAMAKSLRVWDGR